MNRLEKRDGKRSAGSKSREDRRKERLAAVTAECVATAFGLDRRTIGASGRGMARAALARQIAIYLAHTRLQLTLSTVALLFGRDRRTAAHACRRIEDFRDDRRFDGFISDLEQLVDLLGEQAGEHAHG